MKYYQRKKMNFDRALWMWIHAGLPPNVRRLKPVHGYFATLFSKEIKIGSCAELALLLQPHVLL